MPNSFVYEILFLIKPILLKVHMNFKIGRKWIKDKTENIHNIY